MTIHGEVLMLLLCVGSWDTPLKVSAKNSASLVLPISTFDCIPYARAEEQGLVNP